MTAATVDNRACLGNIENEAHPPTKKACLDTEKQCAPKLRVKLLSAAATPPKRGSSGAAGYDLASAQDCIVPARGKFMVDTGLSVAIPEDCYGRVAPRSGLAWKHSIDTGAGVVDCDYRGPLKVILFNFSDTDFEITTGDRIAQLILERVRIADVEVVDNLDDTDRGEGGFGSTGGFGKQ